MKAPSMTPAVRVAMAATALLGSRAPAAVRRTIWMPFQPLPKTSQGTPAESRITFGSMAFQFTVESTFEQMTGPPSSAHDPEVSDARVACPMHERLLFMVEAA